MVAQKRKHSLDAADSLASDLREEAQSGDTQRYGGSAITEQRVSEERPEPMAGPSTSRLALHHHPAAQGDGIRRMTVANK